MKQRIDVVLLVLAYTTPEKTFRAWAANAILWSVFFARLIMRHAGALKTRLKQAGLASVK